MGTRDNFSMKIRLTYKTISRMLFPTICEINRSGFPLLENICALFGARSVLVLA